MLIAEIHGKVIKEARDREDYLTSAVFGHLRYIPPGVFWSELFEHALGMEEGLTLTNSLRTNHIALARYSRLATHFWPKHPKFGDPDLILQFSGEEVPSLFVLIEVKLWAGMSGSGKSGQVPRYMRLLDDLGALGFKVEKNDIKVLVYLTPRDSSKELEESLQAITEPENARDHMFRLQWQDILATARHVANPYAVSIATDATATILDDVAKFLDHRNLAYFSGFGQNDNLDNLTSEEASFYGTAKSLEGQFQGMTEQSAFDFFHIKSGGWM